MTKERYHCYLFEAKSIQQYLFRSGKLKEIISSSERLDSLIDDKDNSPLYKVLLQLGFDSNLLDPKRQPQCETDEFVYFTRCKGGALFCYSHSDSVIHQLRSLWTLTVSQMFPGLEFVDALSADNNLTAAVDKARVSLTADRNQPATKLPYATPIMALCSRTGAVAHPVTTQARYEQSQNTSNDYLNWDSILHLEHHARTKKLKNNNLLTKYSPNGMNDLQYPTNLDCEFPFPDRNNQDIALIHIDGNGMGLLVQALQSGLKTFMHSSSLTAEERDTIYCQVLRQFFFSVMSRHRKCSEICHSQPY
ncbi:hypothetical protein [Vibrio mexicanus]|uniref:hypothetical protein n=1 Tax=Vibrio mexicanus TaxID=1004326 RepID=UPI00063CAC49|nr:hypothetical protein [Vibrio mexicanus]